jgi:hypothetical protein
MKMVLEKLWVGVSVMKLIMFMIGGTTVYT